MSTTSDSYRAAATAAVFLDRSERARIDVSGPDRAKFLHNLTTNEIKRLLVGRGVEAFVTSPQGKTLGYVTILAGAESLFVRTDSGGTGHVMPHLQKYGIFDDVNIDDVSENTFEYLVAGPKADEVVRGAGGSLPEAGELCSCESTIRGGPVRLVRESPLGYPGLTILGGRAIAGAVNDALHDAGRALGLLDLDPSAREALRIEAGSPVFGRDVTAENLPQEVARDRQAISFVKGCYLGQETVARIDALGHVNKLLRGLRLTAGEQSIPPSGAALEVEGKPIGAITSAAFSPGWNAPVALGYVRTAHAAAGSALFVTVGASRLAAIVCDLPMRPA
jgi:folate-binding protein YgfZ